MAKDPASVTEQLKSSGLAEVVGCKKELQMLPDLLTEEENILAVASGIMDKVSGLLVVSDTRVIFLSKGLLGGLSKTIFAPEQIRSVSNEAGIFSGDLIISLGEKKPKKISGINTSSLRRLTEKINLLMAGSVKPDKAFPTTGSFLDELERLGILKEKGLLTEEEFSIAKAKLLK